MSDENKGVPEIPKSGLYVHARPGLQLRDAKVARLKRKLFIECPWLTEADAAIARRFCELQVLIEQVYAFIRATGVMSTTGEVKSAVDAHRRMTLAQNTLAAQLGLTPASRIAIKVAGSRAAFDLPSAMIESVEAIANGPITDAKNGKNDE
jgi:Phage terminase, small subunit